MTVNVSMPTIYEARKPGSITRMNVRGLSYRVREWGRCDDPLLVLLHGWMDTADGFQFMVDTLPDRWHIVAPDWRGFGGSDWSAQGYWFPDYLADLDALLDRYGTKARAAIAGHSMGGNVAGLYAGIRPERVARLVLMEGFGLLGTIPEQAVARYRRWLDEQRANSTFSTYASYDELAARLRRDFPRLTLERAAYLARCRARHQGGDGIVLRSDPRHKRRNPVLYRLEEAEACWRAVTAPVLWVEGDESRYLSQFPDGELRRRRTLFRSLRYEKIPGAGHMLHFDQPKAVADTVADFLSSP